MVQGLSHQPVSSDHVHTAGNDGRIYSGVADTELCRIDQRGEREASSRRKGRDRVRIEKEWEGKGGGRGRRGGGRSGRSERRESGREEEWGVGVLH